MKSGFTLLELLIVISIIGLLSSIVLVAYPPALEKARIAKTMSWAGSVNHSLGDQAVGVWTFDNISGATVYDDSGNNNNGTISGAVQVNGVVGKALSFNGTSNYVIVNNNFVVNPTSLTISAWFKKMGEGANYECVVHKGSDSSVGNSEYWLGVNDTDYLTATIGARAGVGYAAGLTTTKAVLETWYHLLVTWNGSVVKVYVNGELKKQYNLTSYSNIEMPTRVGASANGAGYLFKGIIDDVRIFSSAFTQAQVQQLYAEDLPTHPPLAQK